MTDNRAEKREASLLAASLGIRYAHALRLLRAQVYVMRDGRVARGMNWTEDRGVANGP